MTGCMMRRLIYGSTWINMPNLNMLVFVTYDDDHEQGTIGAISVLREYGVQVFGNSVHGVSPYSVKMQIDALGRSLVEVVEESLNVDRG